MTEGKIYSVIGKCAERAKMLLIILFTLISGLCLLPANVK